MTASPNLIGIGAGLGRRGPCSPRWRIIRRSPPCCSISCLCRSCLPALAGVCARQILPCVTAARARRHFPERAMALISDCASAFPASCSRLSDIAAPARRVAPQRRGGRKPCAPAYRMVSARHHRCLDRADGRLHRRHRLRACSLCSAATARATATACRPSSTSPASSPGSQALIGPNFGPAELDRFADRFTRLCPARPSRRPPGCWSCWAISGWRRRVRRSRDCSTVPCRTFTRARISAVAGSPAFSRPLGLSFTSGLLGLAGVGFPRRLSDAPSHSRPGGDPCRLVAHRVMKPCILVFDLSRTFPHSMGRAILIAAIGLLEPFLHLRQRSVQPTPPPASGAGPNR